MKQLIQLWTIAFLLMCQNLFSQTPIFTETFGRGLLGDSINGVANGAWTTNGNSNGSPDLDAVWEYRGPLTTPNNTVGSRGAFVGTLGPLASSTASNGFMIFDSDYLDNGGDPLNTGTGIAITPHESWLVSSSFSTMGHPNVTLNFTTFYRRYAAECYVLLSNDNGVTWGDTVTIFDVNLGINMAGINGEIVIEDIDYIGNVPNAKIAFYFDGITTSYTSGGGYYFCMIDDIQIIATPPNDLQFDHFTFNNSTDSNLTQAYSMIPVSQASGDTFQFQGVFTNKGTATQTNAIVATNISTPAGTTILASTGISSLAGATDSVYLSPSWIPNQGMGQYAFSFNVSADSADTYPSNNFSDTISFEVTDTTYARDRNPTGNYYFSTGSSYELGSRFDITDTAIASSISLLLGTNTVVGEVISVYLYSINSLGTPLASNQYHVLTANEIGNVFSISIPNTVLPPGSYVAAFQTYSNDVFFTTSSNLPDTQTVFVDIDNSGSWSTNMYVIPTIRLNIQGGTPSCSNVISITQTQSNNCFGGATAEAHVSIFGGTAPYSYLWSNASTSATNSNLSSGWHRVTVTDNIGCISIDSIFISEPDSLQPNISNTQNISCFGNSDGELLASPIGGTSPFLFQWSNNQTDSVSTNISTGWHSVSIIDSNGCVAMDSIFITQPDSLQSNLSISQPISCYGDSNGVLVSTPIGGTAPFSYQWSNTTVSANNSNLPLGWYIVTVTDVNSCSTIDSIHLSEPSQLSNSITKIHDNICLNVNDGNATATTAGGVTPYSFSWSNNGSGLQNDSLGVGWNYLTVTDSNLCTVQDSIEIFLTTIPPLNIGTDTMICLNSSFSISSNGNYTSYLWSDGSTSSTIQVSTHTPDTLTYTLQTTNSPGCTLFDTLQVIVRDTYFVEVTGAQNLCAYESTNLGLDSSYASYLWNTGESSSTIQVDANTLTPGLQIYEVTVTDSYGCQSSDTAQLEVFPEVVIDLGPDTLFWDAQTAPTTYTLDPGSGFVTYQWSDGSTQQTMILVDSTWAGLAYVEVTDSNGCIGRDSINVIWHINVKELEVGTIKLFPNPADNYVTLEFSELPLSGEYTLYIYTITGAQILKQKTHMNRNSQKQFDVSKLPAGTYFFKVQSERTNTTIPFNVR